jgi:uncharacterized protein (TIGR02284 family)
MSTVQDHDIKVLNGLIVTMLDTARGYEEAAQAAGAEAYRHYFEQRAIEHRRVKMMLQDVVRLLGAEPPDSGTMREAARRAMGQIKHKMTGRTDAVLESIAATEERLRAELFAAAVDQALSATVRDAVQHAEEALRPGKVGAAPAAGRSQSAF